MKKKLQVLIIIISIFLLILSIKMQVFSSNKTIIKGEGRIMIAKPILELQKISEEDLNINVTSQNQDYYFKVFNYNSENQICTIQQKYTLKIFTKNMESLNSIKYRLYSINEDNTIENLVHVEDNKTDEIIIDGGVKNEDYYKLHIESVNSETSIRDELFIDLKNNSVNMVG